MAIGWIAPLTKGGIIALVSRTACPETALYDDENTDENRRAVEAGVACSTYSVDDRPIPGSWTDVADNDYFGSDLERLIEKIKRLKAENDS